MTLRASKVAINVREALNTLKKRTGLFGEQVMRAETVDDYYNVVGTNRNVLINGGLRFWQRATSWSDGNNDLYTADRWHVQRYAANSFTISRQLTGTRFSGGPETDYCIRLQRVVGDVSGNSYYLNQPIEHDNCTHLVGKNVTFSFWIRVGATFTGNVSSYFYASIATHANTTHINDGMYYQNFRNATSTESGRLDLRGLTSTTWKRISVTAYIPIGTMQIGVALGAAGTTAGAGANDYFEVTGLQLEAGTVATPFEHRPIQQELALCQRYYQQIGGGTGDTPFMGSAASTTRGYGVYSFPVTMRTAPTVSINGSWTWVNPSFTSSLLWTASTVLFVNQRNLTFQADVASGLTQGFALIAQTSSGGGDLIKFNAEL